MPLHRQLALVTVASVLCLPVGSAAQSLASQASLSQFYDLYNLQHALLAGLAEQDCASLDQAFCFKTGMRAFNTMEQASTTTLWITASYRLSDQVHAGVTLDPGIHETLPDMISESNRQPGVAAFANAQWDNVINTRMMLSYGSSAPRYAQDELSQYRHETSTQTSGLFAGMETSYQQPFDLGFLQPYLLVYVHRLLLRSHTAFRHEDMKLATITMRSGFRTVYTLSNILHVSFNLHAERDLRQSSRNQAPHDNHTDEYAMSTHAMHPLRFGASLGGRLILEGNAELTAFASRFTQAFGTKPGTGAGIYFLQRF